MIANNSHNNSIPPIAINVIVTEKHSNPAIELRRLVMDKKLIKLIVSCAFHERPIVILPTFSKNKMVSISTLIDKGIIYQELNKKGQIEYFFTY